jgi:hypothetical protein
VEGDPGFGRRAQIVDECGCGIYEWKEILL